jgi:hypothetical protein
MGGHGPGVEGLGRHTPGAIASLISVANAAWMTTTAGLLYLDAEQQLCVNYLVDDQRATGWVLVG